MIVIYTMASRKSHTVALSEHGVDYKIIKIIPYSDGGFGVYLPYLRDSSEMFLGAIEIPLRRKLPSTFLIPTSSIVEKHGVQRHAKLSIHQDGFVQFSGDGILSGRDKNTGHVKGIGLFTKPLSTPIHTGATFSITFWGLQGFERMESKDKARLQLVRFSAGEQYVLANPSLGLVEKTNSYIICGYVFPVRMSHHIEYDAFGPKITGPIPDMGNAVLTLRVVLLTDSNVFIGLLLRENCMNASDRSASGYIMGSPLQLKKKLFTVTARQLIASVPKSFVNMSENVLPSLLYSKNS